MGLFCTSAFPHAEKAELVEKGLLFQRRERHSVYLLEIQRGRRKSRWPQLVLMESQNPCKAKDMRKTKIGGLSFDRNLGGKIVKFEAANLQTVKHIGHRSA